MELISDLLKEFEHETFITRKFLERVPFDNLDWRPHPKSMTLRNLAFHTAGLSRWVDLALNTDGLDLAGPDNKAIFPATKEELLQSFDKFCQKGKQALTEANEQDLNQDWVLRRGEVIMAKMTKYEAVRHSIKHTAHHRAQLGVYFRMLDIPVPGSYGPSADE